MSLSEERLQILEMIDQGTITAEEGFNLLQALDESDAASGYKVGIDADGELWPDDPETTRPPSPEEMQQWKRWWVIPAGIGAIATLFSAGLMLWAWRASGFGFWFIVTWLPFALSFALLLLGVGSRNSAWLHVRVQQKPGETPRRIAISFPLPLRAAAWFLRTFGHLIPRFDATGLDEVILALGDTSDGEAPLFVDVSENEDGDKVQVFIG